MKLQNVLLGIAHGASESKLRIHMAGDGKDVILLGAGQFVLGCHHFDIVGRARLKTILRKFEFALRQFLALAGRR